MKLIWFLIMFAGGIAIIYYREALQRISGNFAWAEKWLGQGGTFTFYLFVGIGFMIYAIFYVTGTIDAVIDATLGRFIFTPNQ